MVSEHRFLSGVCNVGRYWYLPVSTSNKPALRVTETHLTLWDIPCRSGTVGHVAELPVINYLGKCTDLQWISSHLLIAQFCHFAIFFDFILGFRQSYSSWYLAGPAF